MAKACELTAYRKAALHLICATVTASMLVFPKGLYAQEDKGQGVILADQLWGQVLYEFYQENYQPGLVRLAIADPQGLGVHDDQGLVAKGGMSLALGMVTQAQDIFTELAKHQTPQVQAQAWFWLSKSFFDSAQWSMAQQGLQKTQAFAHLYRSAEREQLAYMHSQMLVVNTTKVPEQWQFSAALEPLPEGSGYLPYLNYNRGLMQLNQGLLPEALLSFELALGQVSAAAQTNWTQSWWGSWASGLWPSPVSNLSPLESAGLSDRLYLAMGYAHLGANQPYKALDNFANIRQQQQDSAKALIGYAQALVTQGEIPLALAIWQKVSEDFPGSLAALQSLLAMAWQLEHAGDEQQAWQKLQGALEQLTLAQKDVNKTLGWLQQDDFLFSMISTNASGGQDVQVQNWPKSQGDILQSLLSGQSKQQLTSWLDLHQQQSQLQIKQTDLAGFRQLLEERQQSAIERGEKIAQGDFVQHSQDLQRQLSRLTAVLVQAESQQDASLLANQTQLAQLARLKKAQVRLADILKAGDLSPSYAGRLARVEGILKWQFADNYHPLLWQHKQSLQQAKSYLQQTVQSQTSLLARIGTPPTYTLEYQKITHMELRIQGLQQNIKQLQLGMVELVTGQARQALSERVVHLQQFQQNIRLAMLRLQDKDRNPVKDPSDSKGGSDAQ
jgi:hypothetical protein